MKRFDDTTDIDSTRRTNNLILRLLRIVPHFDLLPDHTFIYAYPSEMRRINRQHRLCLLTGHLWEVETHHPTSGAFVLKCVRCFPHIDSRKTVISYAPFTTVERKTD